MPQPLKPSPPQTSLNRASTSTSVRIVVDGEKKLRLPLDRLRTLADLRTAIERHSIGLNRDDQFVDQDQFPIAVGDEHQFRIENIWDSKETIHIRRRDQHRDETPVRPPSATRFQNSTASSLRGKYPVVRVSDISTATWIHIMENNTIFRGRIIRADGPHISHQRLFRMKPEWEMNMYAQDRTEWRTFTTKDQIEHEFHWAKMFNFHLNAHVPFVGLQNEVGRSRRRLDSNSHEYVYRSFQFDVPRVVCSLEPNMMVFEPDFLRKIDQILRSNSQAEGKYQQLYALFNEYGNYCAMHFVLGGQIVSRFHEIVNEHVDEKEHQQILLTQFEAAIEGGEISAGFTRERSTMNNERRQSTVQFFRCEKIGGDTLKVDKEEWLETLNNIDTWRVIEYQYLEPVYRLLDTDRKQRIEEILQHVNGRTTQRVSVPELLAFDPETSLYRMVLSKNHGKKTSTTYSFFFIPTEQRWIWHCTSRSKDAWWPVHKNAHDDEVDPSVNQILQTLGQGNVYPPEEMIERCRSFESAYRVSALSHLTFNLHL